MTKKPITFISFCVDIDRGSLSEENNIKRDFSLYRVGMNENIDTIMPLVMYTSDDQLILPEHRNENNFRHHIFTKETIESEFPNFDLYKKTYPNTHKDEIATSLFYYVPLVVLKLKKIIDVINENPFGSEYFFWMDCFFTRGIVENDFLYNEESYNKMVQNVTNKIDDKFVLLNFGPRPFGFFWGGSKKALLNVYENYFDIFFEFLPKTILTEELLFKEINQRNPDLMNVIQVDRGDQYKIACQNYLTK